MQQPYDGEKLDRLMQEAGVDLVLANSRENVRYLCGGYYFHFHERFTAIGHGQYMALAGIPRGDAGKSFLIGGGGELGQAQDQNLWIPELIPSGRVPAEAAADAAHAISERGLGSGTIAVEENFLPAAAKEALSRALPNATFVEALPILEELRAIKTPEEIELYRRISQADAEADPRCVRDGQARSHDARCRPRRGAGHDGQGPPLPVGLRRGGAGHAARSV